MMLLHRIEPPRAAAPTIALLALLALGAATTPAPARDWYVDVNHPDCLTGSGGPLDPFCSINAALFSAGPGDTIHIAPGTYPENLIVFTDGTLIGTGGDQVTFVDGQAQDTVVKVLPGVTASMDGLTIQNGYRNTFGGGGIDNRGTLTLRNSTVSGNVTDKFGGGIYNDYGNVYVYDSVITGNTALYGGGIDNHESGKVRVIDSLVTMNTATTGFGGGIANGSAGREDTSLFLLNTTVSNNQTLNRGGGGVVSYANPYEGAYCLMSDSVILDNRSAGDGGGFFNFGAATLINSSIAGNQADFNGGGVYNRGELTVNGCELVENRVIFDGAGLSSNAGDASLLNTTVAGNVAPSDGGGIHNQWGNPVAVTHTILADNVASSGPDCRGTLNSTAYNLIENTSGCTVIGDLTGNITGVDPAFVNSGNGDYRLTASSVAVEAGDPTSMSFRDDLAGNPRVLDGDLDRVRRIDMGAHEFNNVHLDVSGNLTPGGTVTLTTTGTAGMFAFLWVGTAPGVLILEPYGPLYINLTSPYYLLPFTMVPGVRVFTVPVSTPVPLAIRLQETAVNNSRAGNMGNLVDLEIQ